MHWPCFPRRLPPKQFLLLMALLCAVAALQAQQRPAQDTAGKTTRIKRWQQSLLRRITVRGSHPDSVLKEAAFQANYYRYAGKVVRHIYFYQVPFGGNIYDTSQRRSRLLRRIDQLHIQTQKRQLGRFMFVRQGDVLDPFRLADNERFFRDLPFVQDARIEALPTLYEDSVDLMVNVKDVFSIGGRLPRADAQQVRGEVYDLNFLGGAQRLGIGFVWDKMRQPRTGLELNYTKYALGRSFVRMRLRHGSVVPSPWQPFVYERVSELALQRDLYTTTAHWAGGLLINQGKTVNAQPGFESDSMNSRYSQRTTDLWAGWNVGARKKTYTAEGYRNGAFIALRYFDRQFGQRPKIFDPRFAGVWFNVRQVLSEFSLYRINFRKSNYIYGFGRTEDLPFGYNSRLTLGTNDYNGTRRLYAGLDLERLMFDRKNNYFSYRLAFGGNLNRGRWEDNTLFLNGQFITRLNQKPRYLHRSIFSVNYAVLANRRVSGLLGINNPYGIQFLSADTLFGNQRLSTEAQHNVFTKWKLLGFQVGLLGSVESSLISSEGKPLWRGDGFLGFGTGLRLRNEQLVFGTIEARAIYFPRTVTGNSLFFRLTTNLQLRYTGSFVRAPQTAFIQ